MLDINLINEKDIDEKKKNHDELISTMNNNFDKGISSKKEEYEENLKTKIDLQNVTASQLNSMTSSHSLKKSKIEDVHRRNIESEKTRSQTLSNEQLEFIKSFDEENKKLNVDHLAYLGDMEKNHDDKVEKERELQSSAVNRHESIVSNYRNLFDRIEEDAEREIQIVNSKFSVMLRSDQEITRRLKKDHEFVLVCKLLFLNCSMFS